LALLFLGDLIKNATQERSVRVLGPMDKYLQSIINFTVDTKTGEVILQRKDLEDGIMSN
jgi:hypothetical protein